jgi:hypothetical protein
LAQLRRGVTNRPKPRPKCVQILPIILIILIVRALPPAV